jgi:hypothetical protein
LIEVSAKVFTPDCHHCIHLEAQQPFVEIFGSL